MGSPDGVGLVVPRAGDGIDAALIRAGHDPSCPVRDTGYAARALSMTRQGVVAGIKRGSIPGYATLGQSRARWWVLEAFLAAADGSAGPRQEELDSLRARLAEVEDELVLERSRNEARRVSQERFAEAVELMSDANRKLVDAYRVLDRSDDVEAGARVGRWVPDRMDGGM